MDWPELLVVVRHAESYGNVLSKPTWRLIHVFRRLPLLQFLGRDCNWRLTRRGRTQTESTALWLRRSFGAFDAYYASEFRRSKETLRLIAPNEPFFSDARLNELPFRAYTTGDEKELAALLLPRMKETREFIDMLRRRRAGQRILIVGHSVHAKLLHAVISGFPFEETVYEILNGSYLKNAAISVYRRDGGRMLRIEHNIVPWRDADA